MSQWLIHAKSHNCSQMGTPQPPSPVAGFQSAVFLELEDGKFGVCVTYRDDAGSHVRFLRLWNMKELERICDYMHWMTGEQNRPSDYPMSQRGGECV